MSWRSSARIGGVSTTPSNGFSLWSGTAGSAAASHTTPISSRRFSGTSTTSPGCGSRSGGTR
jgi:hypothetical protein